MLLHAVGGLLTGGLTAACRLAGSPDPCRAVLVVMNAHQSDSHVVLASRFNRPLVANDLIAVPISSLHLPVACVAHLAVPGSSVLSSTFLCGALPPMCVTLPCIGSCRRCVLCHAPLLRRVRAPARVIWYAVVCGDRPHASP